jgi:hypothetical protein
LSFRMPHKPASPQYHPTNRNRPGRLVLAISFVSGPLLPSQVHKTSLGIDSGFGELSKGKLKGATSLPINTRLQPKCSHILV